MLLACVEELIRCSSNWKYPDILGLDEFEGELMHTAAWNVEHDMKDKRIAVIGSGSSGVQVVPALQPGKNNPLQARTMWTNSNSVVKELITFIRSPTWITAGYAQKFAGPEGRNFTCKAHFST